RTRGPIRADLNFDRWFAYRRTTRWPPFLRGTPSRRRRMSRTRSRPVEAPSEPVGPCSRKALRPIVRPILLAQSPGSAPAFRQFFPCPCPALCQIPALLPPVLPVLPLFCQASEAPVLAACGLCSFLVRTSSPHLAARVLPSLSLPDAGLVQPPTEN